MARWSGKIGFSNTIEVDEGIWEEQIIEKKYTGILIQNSRRYQSTESINDDINISNKVSIVADSYANHNLFSIKYITFMGAKWKVSDISVERPKLILTIGGVYNG